MRKIEQQILQERNTEISKQSATPPDTYVKTEKYPSIKQKCDEVLEVMKRGKTLRQATKECGIKTSLVRGYINDDVLDNLKKEMANEIIKLFRKGYSIQKLENETHCKLSDVHKIVGKELFKLINEEMFKAKIKSIYKYMNAGISTEMIAANLNMSINKVKQLAEKYKHDIDNYI